MFVCDYDEVFKIKLDGQNGIFAEILNEDPCRFLDSLQHSLGVNEHPSILEINGDIISYNFDPTSDFVTVKYRIHNISGSISFRTFSGDWFAASFSKCGSYLLLAEPYSFELYDVTYA